MARVHFVKKARKDNPAVKAGEPYYFWTTRTTIGKSYHGTKHYSATRPKRSQLTRSAFLSQLYDIEDTYSAAIDAATNGPELQAAIDDAVSEFESLKDETEDTLQNMPEQLQEGSQVAQRVEDLDGVISELESLTVDEDAESDEDADGFEAAQDEARDVQYQGG